MSDSGYTLTEMLVALTILGLTVGGLAAGIEVLGRLQAKDADAALRFNAAYTAQVAVESLFEGHGAVRSVDSPGLIGDASNFTFPCAPAGPCQAHLSNDERGQARLVLSSGQGEAQVVDLHEPGPLSFSYLSAAGTSAAWPPAPPTRQALRAVAILRDSAKPGAQPVLLEAEVWSEQPADCAWDVALQDCRS